MIINYEYFTEADKDTGPHESYRLMKASGNTKSEVQEHFEEKTIVSGNSHAK